MGNQTNQENNQNNENASFYDQADGKFNKAIQNGGQQEKLSKGVTEDEVSTDDEEGGSTYSKNLMSTAEGQVRETEDASLQDDTYAFDEDNTDNEEYHDAGDVEDFDIDNDDDFVQ